MSHKPDNTSPSSSKKDPEQEDLGQGIGDINLDREPGNDVHLLYKTFEQQQVLLITINQNLCPITQALNLVKEEQLKDKHLIQQQQLQINHQNELIQNQQSSTKQIDTRNNQLISTKSHKEPAITHLCFLGRMEELLYFLDTISNII